MSRQRGRNPHRRRDSSVIFLAKDAKVQRTQREEGEKKILVRERGVKLTSTANIQDPFFFLGVLGVLCAFARGLLLYS